MVPIPAVHWWRGGGALRADVHLCRYL